ncbi:MAG: hypothetical protein A3J08_02605 [Candidatus Lloydbacteria bacterium RIFCSPLOWO2_02_FULL_51_11]|nr:MAG: hypothetical protein A3J08_02605 [Candidatus Lloydbacteria bacterium RIFCSPLOWO2_02_FULL_51_11]
MDDVMHLGYHYVRNEKAPGPNCSPARLRAQIRALKEGGYEFLTCEEVVSRLTSNRPLPEKHATLSFDDGLKDQFTTVFPILQNLGIRGTFFYITCALDGKLPPVIGFQILIELLGAKRLEEEILPKVFQGTPYVDLLDAKRYDATGRKVGEVEEFRRIKWMFNHWPAQAFKQEKIDEMFAEYVGEGSQEQYTREWFMSGNELRVMATADMEITSHTVSHPALDVTGLADIEQELAVSRRRLMDEVPGAKVHSFGWTFGGKFRPAVQKIAMRHYASAWNFLSARTYAPERMYENLADIPRLHEQVFSPASCS